MAFKSGQLQKSDKIFISSSATGKDIGEIMNLTPHVMYGMGATFFYHGLEFNNVNSSITSLSISNNVTQNASRDIHDEFANPSELDALSGLGAVSINLIRWGMGIY